MVDDSLYIILAIKSYVIFSLDVSRGYFFNIDDASLFHISFFINRATILS